MTGILWLLQSATGDPVPFGPSSWEWRQWAGTAGYLALFLLFAYVVARWARPRQESELPPED